MYCTACAAKPYMDECDDDGSEDQWIEACKAMEHEVPIVDLSNAPKTTASNL